MPKPQGKCIYCGGPGLTKEHLYADWFRRYIPRELDSHGIQRGYYDVDSEETKTDWKTGDIHAKRIRRVCLNCNRGWMSRLQERAKPFLVPLVQDNAVTLNRDAQKVLAAWVAMTVMTGEFATGDDMVAISQADRDYLRTKLSPPPEWRIWIARYRPAPELMHWTHNAMPLEEEGREGVTFYERCAPNSQSTSICFGKHLFVHAMSSQVPIAQRLIANWQFPTSVPLRQIFPLKVNSLIWPPTGTLSGKLANLIANSFFDLAREHLTPATEAK